MIAPRVTHLLQASPATALPGTWKLARGRAITLQPVQAGVLRIAHGRVWATVDGPHGHTPQDSGDHVLEVGRSMVVRAGQRVVIESWNRHGSAYFSWDLLPEAAVVAPQRSVAGPRVQWAPVLQPLADLRLAGGLAVRAAGQLMAGLVQLAGGVLHVRAPRAAPAACGAHGALG